MYLGSKALTDIALLLSSIEGENALTDRQGLAPRKGFHNTKVTAPAPEIAPDLFNHFGLVGTPLGRSTGSL
jgi:hypothetical protein